MNLQQRAKPSSQVIFQEVAGETILLDMNNEEYFGLDETGTRVWELLTRDDRLQSVLDAMLLEFDVGQKQLEDDLDALLAELLDAGLIIMEPV